MAQVVSFARTAATEKVGESLLRHGCITPDQLDIALHEQRRSGRMLGVILVELGFLEEESLADVLAERGGFASIDLKTASIDTSLLRHFPADVAKRCRALPVRQTAQRYEVAMADPYDLPAVDEVRFHAPAGLQLVPLVAAEAAILEALELHAPVSEDIGQLLDMLQRGETDSPQADDAHPVVRLVDVLLADAVRRKASDVHFEPEPNAVRVRYRIDGVMRPVRLLHRAHWPEISHRLKIMAGMNIADTRSMQDGRFEQQVGGARIDFRAAVMPTVQGENIVVRVLDHRRALLPLERLGFGSVATGALESLLQRPEGIVLVTGPTGSGKTTSLYAMLSRLRSPELNIMTLEEPVEYQFDMIRQTSVQERRGLGFADGVRGILRQAPDVIFIGEVRDPDTAQMALRAAMTGHQVFSTLHCIDALGALPRLFDLGLTPRAVAGNVTGVVAQRLVRALCPACRILRPAQDAERRFMAVEPITKGRGFAENQSPWNAADTAMMVPDAAGCAACEGQGRKGRLVVAEVLRVTPALDELIAADAPRSALMAQMRRDGFQSMLDDGRAKIREGLISFADLARAVDVTRGG